MPPKGKQATQSTQQAQSGQPSAQVSNPVANPGTPAVAPAQPAAGIPPTAGPKNPRNPKPSKAQTGTPFDSKAAHAAIANFDSSKLETEATRFDVNLSDIDNFTANIAEASMDALTRMNMAAPGFQAQYTAALQQIVDYHLAYKLLLTCTEEQKAELGPFKALGAMLEAAPLPTPLVDLIQLYGNFKTTEEDWQMLDIRTKILALLQRPHADVDHIQVNLISQIGELERDYGPQLNTLPLNLVADPAGAAVIVQYAPMGIDFTNAVTVAAVRASIQAGLGRSQQADVDARALIANFFAAGVIPAAGAQPALIAAWTLVFNETLVFSGDRPSAIKEAVGANIGRYGRLYSPATKRVWNVSSASTYTESGSPAQLLVWTQARAAATSPLDVNPSDFASMSLTNLQPRIISRPLSWRITQSSTAGTIEQAIYGAARKTD